MDVDAETLISLIESRPAIYDYTLKEHHLRDFIEKLWEEIAIEIKATVADCKSKWTVLRNSFARALRIEKNVASGSGSLKRKKWYLMDSMLFLRDFVGQHKKQEGNFAETNQNNQESDSLDNFEFGNYDQPIDVVCGGSATETRELNLPADTPKLRRKPTDLIVQPMLEFLKSRSEDNKVENQHLSFFKGLIPDLEKLPPLQIRQYKETAMSLLYQYLAAHEEANI